MLFEKAVAVADVSDADVGAGGFEIRLTATRKLGNAFNSFTRCVLLYRHTDAFLEGVVEIAFRKAEGFA